MLPQPRGFGKLAPWKTKKAEAYVRTLSLDVDFEAAARLGDVQGLLSTVTDARTGDILSANIEEAFAVGVEESLNKLSVSVTLEESFESAVSRVNLRLKRLLGEHGLPVNPEEVQGAIVAQKGREVAAAVWGRPSLLLFRQGVQGGPRFFDVLEDDDRDKAGHSRGFTNLISGKISGKDRMVISNRNVIELLTEHAVKDILSAPRTETATMLLRDALLARHEDLSLALLLLDGAPVLESTSPAPTTTPTTRTVTPAGPVPVTRPAPPRNDTVIDKGVDMSTSARPPLAEASGGRRHDPPSLKLRGAGGTTVGNGKKVSTSMIRNVKGGSVNLAKIAQKVARQTGQMFGKAVATTKKRIIEARATEHDPPSLKLRGAGSPSLKLREAGGTTVKDGVESVPTIPKLPLPDRIVNVWNNLTPKSRYLLIAIMVLVFLLNVSLGALGWQRGQERSVADYEKGVAAIRQQIDSAEASMIYRDEDRARRLLQESAAAIAALPTNDEDRAVTKHELQGVIAAKFAELRRSVPLGAPEVLSAVVTQSGTPSLARLAFDGTSYWSVSTDGSVFKISPQDGSAQLMHTREGGSTPDVFLATRNGALTGGVNDLDLVTTGGHAMTMTLPLGDLNVNINDATTFGSRLYFLDSPHNRILRFRAVEGGYGTHDFYVKDATDLSDTVSLAIDGYVYVLKGDAGIIRLLRGENTDFHTPAIDPAMTTPLKLRTPSDVDDLYVLDGANPRVVRFNKKSGSLVAQYEADALAGATDFWVDQDARTIVAVSGNRLLRFTWPEEE
ncbi:MAG: hypothetical protein U9Q03_00040 [Patescibacteria group bacterium]|nr:hypothetical protein [Patescibacteria group bacterium]